MKSQSPKADRQIETLEPLVLMSASIDGTDAADWISGDSQDNVIDAGGGDDEIYAPMGNNAIDGGDGIDTLVVYEGSRADFETSKDAEGVVTVQGIGLNGLESQNRLTNVERILFNDGYLEVADISASAATDSSDTGVADTGAADTGVADTGVADTGVADTGVADTGVADTGVADTSVADTGVADTGVADTGVADTGADSGSSLLGEVTIQGTSGNEWISGSSANDVIDAGAGNDEIYAPSGNNVIDGGDGEDTLVIYEGTAQQFEVTRYSNGAVQVFGPGQNGQDVTNTLYNVERILFNDGAVEVDTLAVTAGAPDTTDPAPVDPGPVDPGPVDPGPVDPGPVDPGPVDPGPVDPTPVDPTPVAPENNDPVAVKDKYVADFGSSVWGNVLDNDSDSDGDSLTVTLKTLPQYGSVTLNADGSFDYIPNDEFFGDDVFEYTVTDGQGGMAMSEACIHIMPPVVPPAPVDPGPVDPGPVDPGPVDPGPVDPGPVDPGPVDPGPVAPENNDPVAVKDKYVADFGSSVWGNVLDNDSDSDGDSLTVTLKTPPQYGSVTLNADGSFDYIPNDEFFGDDVFEYTVTDGQGGMAMSEACIHIMPPVVPPATASLGDRVWLDSNNNGLQDAGEASIAGVTVQLKDGNGEILATQQTDATGYYLFEDLAAGEYAVGVVVPAGFEITSQDAVGNTLDDSIDSDFNASTLMTDTIVLSAGEENLTLDAGLVLTDPETASLGDRVWLDSNYNGLQDAGEASIAGVTVQLKDGNGEILATQQTDATGYYLFEDLAAGEYSVGVVVPAGFEITSQDAVGNTLDDSIDSDFNASTLMTDTIVLSAGEENLTLDAGLVLTDPETASLGDRVWLDSNYNGLQDAGEASIAGVTVQLKDGNGEILATQQTDATGYYLFEDLAAGEYSVGVVVPAGFEITSQDAVGNTLDDSIDSDFNASTLMTDTIVLSAGEENLTLDAGLVQILLPTATGDLAETCESHPVTVDVLANDVDAEGRGLTILSVGATPNGTISTNADGTLSYTANDGFTGIDTFTYTVQDGSGDTSQSTVSVTVTEATNATLVTSGTMLTEGEQRQVKVSLDEVVTEDTIVTLQIEEQTANLAPKDVKFYTGYSLGDYEATFYYGEESERDAALDSGSLHNQRMFPRYGITDAELAALPVGVENAVNDFHLVNSNGDIIDVAADGTFEVTIQAGQSMSETFFVKGLYDAQLADSHDAIDAQEATETFELQVVSLNGDDCVENDATQFSIKNAPVVHTPVALDLNGDGKIGVTGETSSYQKDASAELGRTVDFDIDADGDLDTIEWFVGDGDGILVDASQIGADNSIDGSALFGDGGGGYSDGYEKLAEFDSNDDGQVSDLEILDLALWIDDGDAILEDGELQTLSDYNVVAISTDMEIVRDEDGRELMQSTAVLADGSEVLTEDVWFRGE